MSATDWVPSRTSSARRVSAWCWLGLRCARLIVVLPAQLGRAREGSRQLLEAYRRTVVPIVTARVDSAGRRTEIDSCLAGWAVQGGYLVYSYGRLVGRRDTEDIAVVASSFTRLYDDLLDERRDCALGQRVGGLFAGQEVVPGSEIEALLIDLFSLLDARVPEHNADVLHAHLRELHRLQLEVVDQRSDRTAEEITALSIRKGGAGMTILGGLVNPDARVEDFDVLYRLGGLLQLIDDFDDAFEDREVLTSATWSCVPYGELVAELRSVSRALALRHDASEARAFVDGLCNWLVLVGLRRVLDRVWRFDGRLSTVPKRRLAMITARKQHIR